MLVFKSVRFNVCYKDLIAEWQYNIGKQTLLLVCRWLIAATCIRVEFFASIFSKVCVLKAEADDPFYLTRANIFH